MAGGRLVAEAHADDVVALLERIRDRRPLLAHEGRVRAGTPIADDCMLEGQALLTLLVHLGVVLLEIGPRLQLLLECGTRVLLALARVRRTLALAQTLVATARCAGGRTPGVHGRVAALFISTGDAHVFLAVQRLAELFDRLALVLGLQRHGVGDAKKAQQEKTHGAPRS